MTAKQPKLVGNIVHLMRQKKLLGDTYRVIKVISTSSKDGNFPIKYTNPALTQNMTLHLFLNLVSKTSRSLVASFGLVISKAAETSSL